MSSNEQHPMKAKVRPLLRRVVIDAEADHPNKVRRLREERQAKVLEHHRASMGYADDVDLRAHDNATFRMINERKELDRLPGAETVLPLLENWRYWDKINDWPSRNKLLEELLGKVRRREASEAELQFLVAVCRPAMRGVMRELNAIESRVYVPGLNRAEERQLAGVTNRDREHRVRVLLLETLVRCPQSFPKRFFGWLKDELARGVLQSLRSELGAHPSLLDADMVELLQQTIPPEPERKSFGWSQWLRSLDLDTLFEHADEFANYAKVRGACRKAVDRLPDRQRHVIDHHYYRSLTQAEIANADGLAPSTVRNMHAAALRNLREDTELFELLRAIGRVTEERRKEPTAKAA